MPYDVPLLVIYTITLASLVRLITGQDALTEAAHHWVIGKIESLSDKSTHTFDTTQGSSGWWTIRAIFGVTWFTTKMLSCYWCAAFWVAIIMLWGHGLWLNPAILFMSLALAMRFVAGLLIHVSR